jgi:hypothetical protein
VGYIKTCGSNGMCVRVLCRVQGAVALGGRLCGSCAGQVAHGLLNAVWTASGYVRCLITGIHCWTRAAIAAEYRTRGPGGKREALVASC